MSRDRVFEQVMRRMQQEGRVVPASPGGYRMTRAAVREAERLLRRSEAAPVYTRPAAGKETR